MKSLVLTRLLSGSHGTFGRLTLDGKEWWVLERPLTGAHPAIPAGRYGLRLGMHHAGTPDAYPCYWLENVPDRSAIQIHVANWAHQLEGCLAPGHAMEMLLNKATGQKELGVSGSGDAFKEFMAAMGDPADILIQESY